MSDSEVISEVDECSDNDDTVSNNTETTEECSEFISEEEYDSDTEDSEDEEYYDSNGDEEVFLSFGQGTLLMCSMLAETTVDLLSETVELVSGIFDVVTEHSNYAIHAMMAVTASYYLCTMLSNV